VGEKAIEAAGPAISTLAQNLIGAGFVVVLLASCLMVWQLIRIQNARVQDQKDIADRVEKLTQQSFQALSNVKEALNGLEREQQVCNQTVMQVSTKLDMLASRGT
jgi:hypothetical protein